MWGGMIGKKNCVLDPLTWSVGTPWMEHWYKWITFWFLIVSIPWQPCDFSFPIGLDNRSVHCKLKNMVGNGTEQVASQNWIAWCSISITFAPVDFGSCVFSRFTKKCFDWTWFHGCSTCHLLYIVPVQHLKCVRSWTIVKFANVTLSKKNAPFPQRWRVY